MLDDVLGLIILAVVSSLVISGAVDIMVVLRIIVSALLFFAGTLYLGPIVLRKAIYFSVFWSLGKQNYLFLLYLS